tara:strand:- start:4044 stop:4313 length:270 start_codon:yes stop_codon:yes gene_type:complete
MKLSPEVELEILKATMQWLYKETQAFRKGLAFEDEWFDVAVSGDVYSVNTWWNDEGETFSVAVYLTELDSKGYRKEVMESEAVVLELGK